MNAEVYLELLRDAHLAAIRRGATLTGGARLGLGKHIDDDMQFNTQTGRQDISGTYSVPSESRELNVFADAALSEMKVGLTRQDLVDVLVNQFNVPRSNLVYAWDIPTYAVMRDGQRQPELEPEFFSGNPLDPASTGYMQSSAYRPNNRWAGRQGKDVSGATRPTFDAATGASGSVAKYPDATGPVYEHTNPFIANSTTGWAIEAGLGALLGPTGLAAMGAGGRRLIGAITRNFDIPPRLLAPFRNISTKPDQWKVLEGGGEPTPLRPFDQDSGPQRSPTEGGSTFYMPTEPEDMLRQVDFVAPSEADNDELWHGIDKKRAEIPPDGPPGTPELTFRESALQGQVREPQPHSWEDMQLWVEAQSSKNHVGMGRLSGYSEDDIKSWYLGLEADSHGIDLPYNFDETTGKRIPGAVEMRRAILADLPDEVVEAAEQRYLRDATEWFDAVMRGSHGPPDIPIKDWVELTPQDLSTIPEDMLPEGYTQLPQNNGPGIWLPDENRYEPLFPEDLDDEILDFLGVTHADGRPRPMGSLPGTPRGPIDPARHPEGHPDIGRHGRGLAEYLQLSETEQQFLARSWADDHPDLATPWQDGVVGGGQPLAEILDWWKDWVDPKRLDEMLEGPPGTPLGVTGDPDFQTIEEATREAMGIEDALDDIGLFPEGQELMPYWENVAIKSGYIHGMPDTAAAGESLHDYLNRLYFDTDESLHAVYEKIYDHATARLEELDQFISSPRPHGGLGRRPGDGTDIWQDGHPLDRNPGPDERRPLPDTYTLEEQNQIWREEIDRINWDGVLQGSPVEDYGALFDELIRDQRKVALRNLGSGISIGGAAAVTAGTVFPEQVEKVVSGLASFNDGWWSWIKEFPEHLDWVVRTTGATVDGMEQGTRSTGSPVLDGLSDGFREEAGSWMGSMGGGVVPVVGRQDASVLKGLSKDLSEQGHNGQAMFPNDIRREIENGDAMIVGYRSDADYERAVAESGEYGIEVDRHFWRKPNRKNIRPAEGQPWTSEHLKKLATTNYFYPDAGLRRGPR